jgi:hypothetical protein
MNKYRGGETPPGSTVLEKSGKFYCDAQKTSYLWNIFLGNARHHHHHCHLANTESGNLLTPSGLTLLQVSSMVSPHFFCPLVCSFYYYSR